LQQYLTIIFRKQKWDTYLKEVDDFIPILMQYDKLAELEVLYLSLFRNKGIPNQRRH
jgi:hypothetical protein